MQKNKKKTNTINSFNFASANSISKSSVERRTETGQLTKEFLLSSLSKLLPVISRQSVFVLITRGTWVPVRLEISIGERQTSR